MRSHSWMLARLKGRVESHRHVPVDLKIIKQIKTIRTTYEAYGSFKQDHVRKITSVYKKEISFVA